MKRVTGTYEKIGTIEHFIPNALPPKDPVLTLSNESLTLYEKAVHRLGQLNEMANRLPDSKRFIKAYVIKEALLTSAIEGIHTTLLDIFTQPLVDAKPSKETQLVLNYTYAVDVALELMQTKNPPLATQVLLQAHGVLLKGEGERVNPGKFRQQSVRVGSVIPAPAQRVPGLMADLEHFIHEDGSLPPLIKAGLAHVQFETIHPFLDGNGRIGRLLIVLMLIENNVLNSPILYPSYYFKKHSIEYYHRLDGVRTVGDFEGWIGYYLKAIEASSFDAYRRAKDIETLEKQLRAQVQEAVTSKAEQADGALSILFQLPMISVTELAHRLDKSYNVASGLIDMFIELGILHEVSAQKRNKLFMFKAYMELLEKEYGVEDR